MENNQPKTRSKPAADALERRKALAEAFPKTGKVRASQIAARLGLGVSTWWLYVKEGRVKKPTKYSERVSVWDSDYINDLAANGIPPKQAQEGVI